MAWITPKTDWSELDRCAYTDINRITGNLNELAGTSLKTDYNNDDIISESEWSDIVDTVLELVESEHYYNHDDVPGMDATALNLNIVEGLTQELADWIELKRRQAESAAYAGEGYIVNDFDLFVR